MRDPASGGNRTHVFTKDGYKYPVCYLIARPQSPYSHIGKFAYIRFYTPHSSMLRHNRIR